MKKALMIVSILVVAVISTACINNIAVQELNNKAAEFMQKGDYESAMNRLQASLDLDSTIFQTHYNLGVAAINAKKYEVAIEALQNGVKLKPDYPDFYYSLGVAQIGLADDIIDEADVDEEASADTEKGEVKVKTEVKAEDVEKAKELRKSAIENLVKYIEMVPDSKDAENIQEMIKQSEEFINGEKKEEDKN
jgi:tetratricopeptide (TPR) repeat protein